MVQKKAQTSFEFVIIVGFLLTTFVIFFIVMQTNLQDDLDSRANAEIKEIALIVKNEIDLAAESINGYNRNFTLPLDVYGEDYNIWINQSTVFVERKNKKDIITMPLQEMSGQIIKFENNIKKENGEVKLNQ